MNLIDIIFNNNFSFIAFLLISIIIIVNGWTDAPNAITSSISTNTLSIKKAILISVIFNFFGIIIMSLISSELIETVSNLVVFPSNNKNSLIALCSGMISVIIWSLSACYFGIPTSESHALLSGITGAAICINNGFNAVNINEWMNVFYGIIFTTIFGIIISYTLNKFIKIKIKNIRKTQITLTAALSFMHGAQDGLKFIGVFVILVNLLKGSEVVNIPFGLILYCSLLMGLGTLFGGKKIIHKTGNMLMPLKKEEGIIVDFVSSILIFLSTLSGLPVSTTHVRTLAVIGIGINSQEKINIKIIKELVFAWIMTFPCCTLIGYIITDIIIHFI